MRPVQIPPIEVSTGSKLSIKKSTFMHWNGN
uniref:Uncharacterized protein n=1 Tax=Rhizophora mucronata TaxID=61149 RepID=A0A2P2N881_RHIMU